MTRHEAAVRRSAPPRPSRWKVQLELAPAEIAFVYRQGLARGAEVCRRGSQEWRPLVTTPELREALAPRSSMPNSLQVASGVGPTLSQTLAVTDPTLAALFLNRRTPQLSKSGPPPSPAVGKSGPPPPPAVGKSRPLPTFDATTTPLPPLDTTTSLEHMASSFDRQSVPFVPLRLAPLLPPPLLPPALARRAVLASGAEPAVRLARPIELSLVAAVAVVLTLAITAFTLRAEAPRLTELVSMQDRPEPHGAGSLADGPTETRGSARPTIPVVSMLDLPVEGGRSGFAFLGLPRAASTPEPARSASSSGAPRASLARALGRAAAAARSCGDGPVSAQVVVTFGPSGVPRDIHFASAPPVALRSCVLNAVARTHIAPFVGDPVTVSKTLRW